MMGKICILMGEEVGRETHIYNPSTQGADAGGLKVGGQFGLHSEMRPSQRLVSKATS